MLSYLVHFSINIKGELLPSPPQRGMWSYDSYENNCFIFVAGTIEVLG